MSTLDSRTPQPALDSPDSAPVHVKPGLDDGGEGGGSDTGTGEPNKGGLDEGNGSGTGTDPGGKGGLDEER